MPELTSATVEPHANLLFAVSGTVCSCFSAYKLRFI